MGDFVDDSAVHPALRNDLGLLFLAALDGPNPANLAPVRVEALPLFLGFGHIRLAHGEEWEWIRERFTAACAELGTDVGERAGRLTVDWR
ncbi:hypothetical protein ACWC9T_37235 [Kitasatospora sp. NPDC001159]